MLKGSTATRSSTPSSQWANRGARARGPSAQPAASSAGLGFIGSGGATPFGRQHPSKRPKPTVVALAGLALVAVVLLFLVLVPRGGEGESPLTGVVVCSGGSGATPIPTPPATHGGPKVARVSASRQDVPSAAKERASREAAHAQKEQKEEERSSDHANGQANGQAVASSSVSPFRDAMRRIVSAISERESLVARKGNSNSDEKQQQADAAAPLVILCSCGGDTNGEGAGGSEGDVAQTVCENMARAAISAAGPIRRSVVVANHYFGDYGKPPQDDASPLHHSQQQHPPPLVGGGGGENGKDDNGGIPLDLPFWGSTAEKLRQSISQHSRKMVGLAEKRRGGRPVIELPPLLGSSSGGGLSASAPSDISADALRLYFNISSADLQVQAMGAASSGTDQSRSAAPRPPSTCYLPSLEALAADSFGEAPPLLLNVWEKEGSADASVSRLLTKRQRDPRTVRYDYAIVCASHAEAVIRNNSNPINSPAARLFAKRLLLQSAATFVVSSGANGGDTFASLLETNVEGSGRGGGGAGGPKLACSADSIGPQQQQQGERTVVRYERCGQISEGFGLSTAAQRNAVCFAKQRGAGRGAVGVVAALEAAPSDEASMKAVAVPSGPLPRLCSSVESEAKGLTIEKVIKFGTKTGIYAATHSTTSSSASSSSSSTYSTEAVVVKHFAALQYAQFAGFQAFMAWLPRGFAFYSPAAERALSASVGGADSQRQPLPIRFMYPLIIAPNSVCYEPSSNTVLQTQHFAERAVNLKKLMRKEGAAMGFAHRLQIAIQIVCIFNFLHERHPSGRVFSFDDNHPEQYVITRRKGADVVPAWASGSGNGGSSSSAAVDTFYDVKLIDIDTLQLAMPKKASGGDVINADSLRLPLTAYATRCRCFFCKGRSNCMFFNTLEGYAGCGQTAENPQSGDDEGTARPPLPSGVSHSSVSPSALFSHRLCNPSSDVWFLGQLLYYIAEGGRVPFDGLPMAEVIHRLTASQYPTPRSPDEAFNALVVRLFRERPPTGVILEELFGLCDRHRCGIASRQCPAVPEETMLRGHDDEGAGGLAKPYDDLVDINRVYRR